MPGDYPLVSHERILRIVVDYLLEDEELHHLFRYLEIQLSRRGVHFFAPGGTLQRHVACLLALLMKATDSHAWAGDYEKFLDELELRVAVDLLADSLVSRLNNALQSAGSSDRHTPKL